MSTEMMYGAGMGVLGLIFVLMLAGTIYAFYRIRILQDLLRRSESDIHELWGQQVGLDKKLSKMAKTANIPGTVRD